MDTDEKLNELLAITYALANIVAGRVSGEDIVDTEDTGAFVSSAQLVEAARILQQRIKWLQEL